MLEVSVGLGTLEGEEINVPFSARAHPTQNRRFVYLRNRQLNASITVSKSFAIK